MRWMSACAAAWLLAVPAAASQVEVFVVEDYDDLAAGEMDGVRLDADGTLRLGPRVETMVGDLAGPGLALARTDGGTLLVATPAPGRLWKLAGGKATSFAEVKEPLVAALIPMSRGRVAALTGPDGGVRVFDSAGKEQAFIKAPEDVLLLDGAALGSDLYLVGGGDEGTLYRLKDGAKELEVLATVETKHLRSIAARTLRGTDIIVVGSDEEGFVYRWEGGRLRALLDAEPGEVADLLIDDTGRVFAALVDANGRLSEGASSLARDSDDKAKKKKDKKKDKKPRKVKSAEVWRIDPSGSVDILWQSKKRGAYALALREGRLLVGTGPDGQLYELNPAGGERASLLGRAQAADEVVQLVEGPKGDLFLSTAHTGSVQRLTTQTAPRGTWVSAPWDASALARPGRLEWSSTGTAKAAVRTGQTQEPDDTWSAWGPDLARPGVPAAPLGRYGQVRITLEGKATAMAVRQSYLVDNRAPQIVQIDVVGPGWKVDANKSQDRETRSVTFGKSAFSKFKAYRGSLLAKVSERGSGKQTFEPGWRTIFAYVEDEDKDQLRYRFSLRAVGRGDFVEVKDWSDEPFVSLDASRLADGSYQVQVEVDDLPSNGPARARRDQAVSALFRVTHARPLFAETSAERAKGGARLRFQLKAAAPLSVVQCSLGGDEWTPVDPTDGVLDGPEERFDVVLPGEPRLGSASCLAVDEELNEARVDLPVR